MALILNIETTSDACSVALSKNGKLINSKEEREGRSHASKLAVFIEQVLREEKYQVKDLDAVSISKGPGSYTGLRIGVSTAKGLCFGNDLPLIAVHTLQSLTQGLIDNITQHLPEGLKTNDLLVPMIDARRMEVYTAIFDINNKFVEDVSPLILDENAYKDLFSNYRPIFFGNAVKKAKEVIKHKNACFIDGVGFSAEHMIPLSEQYFSQHRFEDLAYFEPFYLKDFQATKPKNKLF
jgi:tRNA threonylcarbamoyladenosine biosynthesis protein TsaB